MSGTVAGQSILDLLWARLDDAVDLIQAEGIPAAYTEARAGQAALDDCLAWGERRGAAQGLALAIAIVQDPYHPDVDAVRAEAGARLEDRRARRLLEETSGENPAPPSSQPTGRVVHRGTGKPVPRPSQEK